MIDLKRYGIMLAVIGMLIGPAMGQEGHEGHNHAPGEHAEAAAATEAAEAPAEQAMTDDQKLSYAIGMMLGNDFKDAEFELDTAVFAEAFKASQAGEESKMTRQEAAMALQQFFMALQAKQQAQAEEAAKANAAKGIAFLEKNAKREGVKTTESGLQYEVLKEGEGESPKATDMVTVHYRGTLIDGTEFDSSYKRGEPTTFPLNRVIPGWTEGVQLMKPGGKLKLYIPSELGYGERGTPGGPIGPDETLIFEVELIKVGQGEEE